MFSSWEYEKTYGIWHNGPSDDEALRCLGEHGWEMVAAVREGERTVFWLKRKRVGRRFARWFTENICFVSWNRYWKGIYIHFIPRYCVRVYLWGIDWHRKWVFGQKERS